MNRSDSSEKAAGVSRRRFIETTGAAGAALTLAGCGGGGGNGDGSGSVTLTADQPYVDSSDAVTDALYEAGLNEDIDVTINAGDFESGQRQNSFASALDAGRGDPDIFMMDSGWTMPFIVRNQIVNLEDRLSQETLDYVENDYLDSAVQTASHPESGDLYGLPLFPDYPVMHYRKDLVEDAGYDPEGENWATEPMTWQEFADIAADVWDQSGVQYGFTTQAAEYVGLSCCTFNETMTSWGGSYFGDHSNLFGPVGDRPITVNEEPVHNTIRMMRSFIYGPDADNAHPDYPKITNSDILEFTEEDAREPFTSGDAVFHRNWPYAISNNVNSDAFDTEDYDVMPLPYAVEEGESDYEGAGGSSHALGGWHLTINPNSDNIDNAVEVLEAFANENVMLTILEEIGNQPPVPSVTANANPDNVGAIGNYLDTLAVAAENTVPRPVTAVWPSQSPEVASEVHSAYLGDKSPQQAMSDLEGRIQQFEDQA
jgi:ABC-type glycerol-3-phosphate transport system substrate-binding protein